MADSLTSVEDKESPWQLKRNKYNYRVIFVLYFVLLQLPNESHSMSLSNYEEELSWILINLTTRKTLSPEEPNPTLISQQIEPTLGRMATRKVLDVVHVNGVEEGVGLSASSCRL